MKDWGDVQATWAGDQKAFVLMQPQADGGLSVSDVFRGTTMPKGTGGDMLAQAIDTAGLGSPARIRFTNILPDQPTLAQLRAGVAPGDTVLGRTAGRTVDLLGGSATRWSWDLDARWIQVEIAYP